MNDSLNVGGSSEEQVTTLPEKFNRWIAIDYYVSMIVAIVLVFCISGEMPKQIRVPSLIGGVALSIVFANVKKYLLLTVLGIYEKLNKE